MSYRYPLRGLNGSTCFSCDNLSSSSSMTPSTTRNSSMASKSKTKDFFGKRTQRASKPIVTSPPPPNLPLPSHLSAAPGTLAPDFTHRLFPSPENTIGTVPPDTFITSNVATGASGEQPTAQPQSLSSSLLLQFNDRHALASDSTWLNLLFWPEHRRDERWCLSITDVINSEV